MRIYKGIVCEIKKNYMIFMTAEGEFLRGTPFITNVQIGDEAEFKLLAPSPLSKKKQISYLLGPALAAAALLLFFLTVLFPHTNNVYANVQIGNELELGVDEKGNVVSVTSLNETNTIETEKLKGLPIDEALTKVVVENPSQHQEISITTKFKKEEPSIAKEKIEKAVNQVREEKIKNNKNENQKNTNKENSSNKGNNGKKFEEKHKGNFKDEQNQRNQNINKDKQNDNSKKSNNKNNAQKQINKGNGKANNNNQNSSQNNSK